MENRSFSPRRLRLRLGVPTFSEIRDLKSRAVSAADSVLGFSIGSALTASVAGGTYTDFAVLSGHSADGSLRAVCDGAHGEVGAVLVSRLLLKASSLGVPGVSSLD